MTLPSPLVPKKKSKHTLYDVKTRKSPKISKIMVFCYFFKQKLHFLAMMCVKVCLHMFLLQIIQINKIKHSGSVSWKTKRQKTRFVCNFNGKSVFRCTQRAITQRHVITLGSIFIKMVLNRAQGLKEKSQEVSARKNNNRQRYNKKCRRGADSAPPPSSFRVNNSPFFRITDSRACLWCSRWHRSNLRCPRPTSATTS